MSDLYEMMAKLKIKPNLIQTHAVSLQLCMDDRADKIEKLALAAAEQFEVNVTKGFSLLSIRHYTDEVILKLTSGKSIEIRQQSPSMIQVLMR
jgi:aspartate kinase